MIHTVSVLKGYNAALGHFFVHLAFFIGSFIVVIIPEQQQLDIFKYDDGSPLLKKDMKVAFIFQQSIHIVAAIVTFLGITKDKCRYMDTLVEVMSMVTVLCMIFMYMFQW